MDNKKPEFDNHHSLHEDNREDDRKRKSYWRNFLSSTQKKMSRGAANISRMLSWAHKDNWRRKNKKK